MSGIGGFSGTFSPALLHSMNESQKHRGPDGEGIFFDAERRLGLCHQRLATVGAKDEGVQPLRSGPGKPIITFDGEIYNRCELRAVLQEQGWKFRTKTDDEVVLAAYQAFGEDFLSRLEGIYAFALYDCSQDLLIVARDGVGVKPLYWTTTSKGVLFASDMRALLRERTVPRSLNRQALVDFLTYTYTVAPKTALNGVFKLKPGHMLKIRQGRVLTESQFWDFPSSDGLSICSDQDAVLGVRDRLSASVSRQLQADVPIGAFLSGGIDSSSIVALAATQGRHLECFTVAHSGEGDGYADDLPYARLVAERYGLRLNQIEVTPASALRIPYLIERLDEPMADPAAINTLLLAERARALGIPVLLSGHGSDDLFGGYRRHEALMLEFWWTWLPRPARIALKSIALALPSSSLRFRQVKKAFRYADRSPEERIVSYFQFIARSQAARLLRQPASAAADPLEATLAQLPGSLPPLHRMLLLDAKHFLADHDLHYLDKACMAAGVEARVPFLDSELIAFAAQLAPNLKVRRGQGKWVLREAVKDLLPQELFVRGKSGFGFPLIRWLQNELRPMVNDQLDRKKIEADGIFDAKEIWRMIDADRAHRIDASSAILSVLFISEWWRSIQLVDQIA